MSSFWFTLYAMFMAWLLEQEDRDDEISILHKVLFRDYNNGCLPSLRSLKGVVDHYKEKHPTQFELVRDQFIIAIKAYDSEVPK